MKAIILLFLLALFSTSVLSQTAETKPFILKLISKPAELRIGRTYKFVFEVRNISGKSLTLCSICGAVATLSWTNANGTGGGTGFGCGSSALVIDDSFDPVTGKTTGSSKIYPYSSNSFFTLPPNGAKRFETDSDVPKEMKPRFVEVNLLFDSKFDGSIFGIKAWTGERSYPTLKMRVRR